ncbi:Aste57867_12030 [Aphanomyces stellatus]|uniref:Aste57867_12030 protein n=1 Tax=Aphanomyces stellatus TaxID=120398 RepID=A0A485KUX4_9STRA|nr:hypothetical protein As57867_011985 [Aphanomyces stellatus]VFT88885.1 Aste57867_12030 [Aphanomyces stellatus]
MTHQIERMRAYRKLKKHEMATLKDLQAELRTHVQFLQDARATRAATLPLAWKDIAKELVHEAEAARTHGRALRRKIYEQLALLREMVHFVAAATSPTTVSTRFDPLSSAWRDFSLPSNPSSRTLAKDWISKQLYHNMDKMFEHYAFPRITSDERVWFDMQITFPETGAVNVVRRQFDSNESLDDIRGKMRENCFHILHSIMAMRVSTGETLREQDGRTRLHSVITANREHINVLCGEFNRVGRVSFVLRQILQDDAAVHGEDVPTTPFRKRHRLVWYDACELPNGCTRKRILILQSHSFVDGETFCIDREAQGLGVSLADCPEHLKEARLRNISQQWVARMLQSVYFKGEE